jgi:amino acid adenylation domain-containing protein
MADIDFIAQSPFVAFDLQGGFPATSGASATSEPQAGSAEIFEFPCSPTQRRFWILDRLQPGASWLNIAVRWRFIGRVEPRAFTAAFHALIHRHEILRTGFVEVDGEPRQRIETHLPIELPVINLAVLPAEAREAEATRITLDLATRPFDLQAPPLARGALLRLSETEWRVLFTLHHIVGDGWSIGIIMKDLADLYERILNPNLPALPAPELHYADVTLWQAEQPRTGTPVSREYWAQRLKALPPFEPLTDRPRPAQRVGRATIATRLLPKPLTEAGTAWARERGTTLFPLALAALASVLHRFATEHEIVIGTQVAGRTRLEMESVIGPFINTLVLRLDAGGDPDFETLFERARDTVEGALAHAETPFEELVGIVRPERSGSHQPLFQVNFIHQRSFVPNQIRKEFQLLDMPSLSPGAPCDLNFFMVERGEGWRFSCEYDIDLYEGETIVRLLALFEAVLLGAIRNPRLPIGDLATAGPEDRTRIAGWNATASVLPAETLPTRIAAAVARSPTRDAVACGTECLSYAELDKRANRLAHLLIKHGVRPGDRVGVCLDRSVWLPVTLLAVLKAGAAYVPFDPDYPAARLAPMAEDADLKAMVTSPKLSAAAPSRGEARLLLGAGRKTLAGLPDHRPDVSRSDRDIAYVLFTSGSTGRPKGVEITDAGLLNHLEGMRREPGFGAEDVMVSVTSISFDIATLEIFLPLMTGARVVIATQEEKRDGAALAKLLIRSGATVLQATPATFHLLLDSGWTGERRLRMLCGGEAMPRPLATRLLPCGELWNMYGPTETTIWSSAIRVRGGDGPVPVGGPMINTRFEVLDERLRPVPIGAPGELMIGGAGLARGYIGKPELTADRFIIPTVPGLGDRLYKTGDLVRWRRDGTLEFLGRRDQQVKLRGHRIELGEIEAALAGDPAVAAAAATLQQGAGEEDRLVAFVVPENPAEPAAPLIARLQRHLAETLPGYMRPAAVATLDALPQTPNGKIDRRHLPRIEAGRPGAVSQALTAREMRIADIWREMLGPIEIRRESDFFDLGGDSLTAARFIARVRRDFDRSLSLASLFENAALGRIVRQLDLPAMAEEDEDPAIVTMKRAGTQPAVWGIATPTIYRKLADRMTLDRPFHVIRPPDDEIDTILARDTLEGIAGYYLDVLRRMQPEGPYCFLGFCAEASVAFEMARQMAEAGETVERLVLIDTWAPGYSRRLGRILGPISDVEYKLMRLADILGRLATGCWNALRTGDARTLTARLPHSDAAYGATAAWRLHLHTAACARAALPKSFGGDALVVRSKVQPQGLFLDRRLGWTALIRGKIRLITVPGDHLGIFSEPGVDDLAAGINALDQTEAPA